MAGAPLRVFYSYSHADIGRLKRLRKHMAMLRRQGLITEWYDHDIEAGNEWRVEIDGERAAPDRIRNPDERRKQPKEWADREGSGSLAKRCRTSPR